MHDQIWIDLIFEKPWRLGGLVGRERLLQVWKVGGLNPGQVKSKTIGTRCFPG